MKSNSQTTEMKVTFSPYVPAFHHERLFPESKNRSRRIAKKLCARFGGEVKEVPSVFIYGGNAIVVNEKYKDDFEKTFPEVACQNQ